MCKSESSCSRTFFRWAYLVYIRKNVDIRLSLWRHHTSMLVSLKKNCVDLKLVDIGTNSILKTVNIVYFTCSANCRGRMDINHGLVPGAVNGQTEFWHHLYVDFILTQYINLQRDINQVSPRYWSHDIFYKQFHINRMISISVNQMVNILQRNQNLNSHKRFLCMMRS